MSASDPFDIDRIVSLWTELLNLQVKIGYYPREDSISFPPPEGRPVDEALCQELHLTEEVITLLKRLPCPSSFDEAWETPIFYESMAIPFTENEWIRNSRDPERYLLGGIEPLRPDFMKPEELALVLMQDEPGHHLILDTKANTIRFFMVMIPPYDSGDEEEEWAERPDDRMHYRNYPARPAVEVLEELVAKFRDLEWVPVRYDGGWPDILTAQNDGDEEHPNVYTNAKNTLREQFGWPDNFKQEEWDRQKNDIWKRLLYQL
ncbi:hypothetical protein BDV96DRAFT_641643 [Lophiotrema nucula]|uniref:Uncharacterized protein n=1 Tax=Lophiotrema nucula TaxID=690887 RepID=A0A6A5ZP55_9PLEO|nr:hypothetical protein BDV96DRAFT_641643 [Lophiotrema nucula]